MADEVGLRVFGQVVVATGTGLPERSGGSISIHYVTAHGVSRQTGLPVSAVLAALEPGFDSSWAHEAGVRGVSPMLSGFDDR
ncbi:MAG: hypothetical protein ACRDLT_12640 [Solirubrobacteraceae bacterium]